MNELITRENVSTLDFAKSDNLLPVVVQHADSGAVLMVGYMNAEALLETFNRRRVVFFSRSKQRGQPFWLISMCMISL